MRIRTDHGLPARYVEVEYIENTSTSFIDTGVVALNKLFAIDMQFTSNATRQLMGIGPNSIEYWGNNKGTWEKIGNSKNVSTLSRCTVMYDVGNITSERVTAWIDGSTTKVTGQAGNWATESATTFQICRLAQSWYCLMKLFGVKVYNASGALTHSFIPCYRAVDNVQGLYDIINQNFVARGNSTAFVTGDKPPIWRVVNAGYLLPSAYKQVEYIESNGTQYIDIDYICKKSSITMELDMMWTGSTVSNFETFIGFMYSASVVTPRIGLHKWSSQLMFGANATTSSGVTPPRNTRFKYKGEFISGAQKLYVDNVLKTSNATTFNFTSNTCPTYIFARYCPNSMNYATMRLYECKIWEESTLVKHLIPCYRVSDSVIGLYDVLKNAFYYNSGTGNFTKGADNPQVTSINPMLPVLPDYSPLLPGTYRRLNYIESGHNGATLAYLDTGLPVHMNWKYEIIIQQSTATTYRCWGAFNQESYIGPNCSLTYISAGPTWALRWESTASNQRYVDLGPIDTNKHTFIFDNGYAYIDEVNKGRTDGHNNSFITTVNAYLFTINPGNTTPSATMKGKVYSYRVWNNQGILQQWFVPCQNIGTGAVGMYDIVRQEFHGSIGGTFYGEGV